MAFFKGPWRPLFLLCVVFMLTFIMTKFSFLSSLLAAGTASADIVQVPINAPHEPVSAIDSFDIANAVEPIPSLGFGTWNIRISPQNTTDAVAAAIEAGYRHIDGAKVYGNQVDVGKGIKKGLEKVGLKRSDIWVTSKLWNDQYVDSQHDCIRVAN